VGPILKTAVILKQPFIPRKKQIKITNNWYLIINYLKKRCVANRVQRGSLIRVNDISLFNLRIFLIV
ncbi:MAG: hypothetical protein Q8839_02320, partial [Candidatus Phytoplasma australasiaticum]|nr:hypothetical protein [Candidatus Phytoplasma australasiaticum]MDV3185801.1 hypothetical protein [Candidatus Phytoplasma australasiaticum]MDV3186325.1 hypothetical protein [Candidatus Phytoplasma australasiaticum]MDV3194554.1 hypothetical protein [Candidatus Phytoplasma australasiaticum]